jgi:hypothetical protein
MDELSATRRGALVNFLGGRTCFERNTCVSVSAPNVGFAPRLGAILFGGTAELGRQPRASRTYEPTVISLCF